MLVRGGRERPLIPRYFDLLVFLIERRHEAVHRRDIFDRVWNDVVVSDSALSQAIRTIRRTLGDDSREPRFIRTVSRHGYRFVFPDVLEEEDDDQWSYTGRTPPAADPGNDTATDPFEPLLQRVTGSGSTASDEEEQREAAELLHALGTSEALRRLGTRPRHAFARALLRDTRWEIAEAGPVPFLGEPSPIDAARALVSLRLRRAARIVAARWAGASIGGGLAGVVGGGLGGLILAAAPGSAAPVDVAAVLAVIGGCCGAAGGAGVGAGLSVAEAVARSQRTISTGLRSGNRRRPRRLRGAVARSMESRRARGRARRHGRRPGRPRHRWRSGARLCGGDIARRRWACGASRSPAVERRRARGRCVRSGRVGRDAYRTASRRRDDPCHRSSVAGIAGDADAAWRAHRRTGFRPHHPCRDRNG